MAFDKDKALALAEERKASVVAQARAIMAARSDQNATLLIVSPQVWHGSSIAGSLSSRLRQQGREVVLSIESGDQALSARRVFDQNPSIGAIELVGPAEASVRTLAIFENVGLVPQYNALFDSERAQYARFDLEVDRAAEIVGLTPEFGAEAERLHAAQKEAFRNGLEFWAQREQAGAKEVVIAISAQHPLINGVTAGPEYQARIEEALNVYQSLKSGASVKFITLGMVHDDKRVQRHKDSVSLGVAGKLALIESAQQRGIELDASQIVVLDRGVGNAEHEVTATSDYVVQNPTVGRLITIASQAQVLRKGILYQNAEVLSEFVIARAGIETFHGATYEAAVGAPSAAYSLIRPELRTERQLHAASREAAGGLYADQIEASTGPEFSAAVTQHVAQQISGPVLEGP